MYTVIVENVGNVLETKSKRDAMGTYKDYVIRSQSNRGRCAGEAVILMMDNEIMAEYLGTIEPK